jgi:hypothetical protein
MSNTDGWIYRRGEGLLKPRPQPADMEIQGGSDVNGTYERRWRVKGI